MLLTCGLGRWRPVGEVSINIEALQEARNGLGDAIRQVADLKGRLQGIVDAASGHVKKAPAPWVGSLYKLDQVCAWLDAQGPLLDRRLDLARQVAAATPGFRPGDIVAVDEEAIAAYDRAVDDAAWLTRYVSARVFDGGDVPQGVIDLLAREQGNPTFARLLARRVDPGLLASFLGGIASRAADLELTADPGLDDFYQREDRLLNLLAGSLSLGARQLSGRDLDAFTAGWARLFAPGIGGPNTAAASLLIGRGAWPDAFYTRLADAITAHGRHGEEWLPAVPLNGVRDPAVNPQTGGHDLIGDPLAGLFESAAGFAPGWFCSYFTGGRGEALDLPGFDYPDGKHADAQTVQVNARLRALLMDYGLDGASGFWFGQASVNAALYEGQAFHTAGIATGTAAVVEWFERDAVVYDHKSWWGKYKHDILQGAALLLTVASMFVAPLASPWLATSLLAADVVATGWDAFEYFQDGDTADGLIGAAAALLLVALPVAGTIRWVRLTRAQVEAAQAGQEISQDGVAITGAILEQGLREADAIAAAERINRALADSTMADQFPALLDDYAAVYGNVVASNAKWDWRASIPFGEEISKSHRGGIRAHAIELGYIPEVGVTPTVINGRTYDIPDFKGAGLVERELTLPKDLWKSSNEVQFRWLDEQAGGRLDGYTWHHTETPGLMQRVPYGVHRIYSHNGGRSPGCGHTHQDRQVDMKHIDMIPGSVVLPLPDDSLIANTERNLRVSFPRDYKDFLKRYGGARPVKGTFLVNGYEWAIDRFLCLLPLHSTDPLICYDIEMTWGQIDDRLGEDPDALGAEMVPIVVLFADDIVCLDYRKSPENPSVVVWLHEESRFLSPVTRPVAASFTEFLELVT